MSHNSITETVTRQEDVSPDKLNQSSTQSPLEPKQSFEYVLTESKRLIKSGFYKKAFNLVESFKADGSHLPPLPNLKLCRRMVICLTKICSRYLNKGELHRIDHFLKLMNKSHEYLQIWHDLLCNYISKTNPRFNHLQQVLTEIPDLYQEGAEIGSIPRIKPKAPTDNQNSSNFSRGESGDKKSSNPFLNKIKKNKTISKENQPSYVEDYLSFDQDSRSLTEPLTGREINTSFHLDEFIKYYLTILLNWANFHKKISKKYDSAYRFLLFANKVAKTLDSCLDPDLLQLVAKARLALGVFYSEFGKHKEAIETLESALNVLQIELSLRVTRSKEGIKNFNQLAKFQETIRHLVLVSLNMSVIYEQKDNYSRTLECLRFGVWFAKKFLTNDGEILDAITNQYNIATQKYDKYLRELGELERVVSDKITLETVEEVKEATNNDHFGKMNYYLYNKFNYDKLNASQFIVLTSPSVLDRDTKNSKSEYLFDEKTEFGESRNWSKIRDLKADGSFARVTTLEDTETHTNVSWKRLSTVGSKSAVREKKKDKVKLGLHADEFSSLTSRRYQTEESYEHEKEEYELNSEEEREHIEKLNRNIKDRTKNSSKKKHNKIDYLDVDNFFEKVVDRKITEKEDELKLHQPKEFKRIVRDYGFFVKNEKYDSVEFGFARRTLESRSRENFGDCSIETKYKPPTFKVAQRNEVKIEAEHMEAKFSTEKRVNQKNLNLRSFLQAQAKSPQVKSVKFATSPDGRDTKPGTLITIEEYQPSTSRSAKNSINNKHTFSSILMKHHENLELNSVHNTLTERQRSTIKLQKKNKQNAELAKFAIFNNQALNNSAQTPLGAASARSRIRPKEINPDEISKFTQTTKNTIQLMMETIEKNLDEDENIRKRIEENKTLVQIEKPVEKFLKVPEDLAKSTEKLSLKAQSHKKMWNFSQLVKNTHQLNKKTVTIKAP